MRGPTIVLVALSTGCFDMGRAPDAPTAAPAPTETEPEAAPAPDAGKERLGLVLEVLPSGGYTYARMEACGLEAWVAGPEFDLEVGSTVAMPAGTGMTNFESPTLGRTFETILFVDWFRPTDEAIDCSKMEQAPPPPPGTHGSKERELPKVKFHGRVLETMEAVGYTYALIEQCGEQTWLAGPRLPLKKGEFVATRDGNEMNNFAAKTLGRTFESIWFVSSIAIAPSGPTCPN